MMLSIRFVEGFTPEGWGGRATKFMVEGFSDELSAGICCSGYLNGVPWFRFSDIYVVRQPVVGATLRVLVHELGHAAIWLLHLPPRWSKALDTKLIPRRGSDKSSRRP